MLTSHSKLIAELCASQVPHTEYREKETPEQARRPPKEISNAATRVGRAFLNAQEKVTSIFEP